MSLSQKDPRQQDALTAFTLSLIQGTAGRIKMCK